MAESTPSIDALTLGNFLFVQREPDHRHRAGYHPDLWELNITQQGAWTVHFDDCSVEVPKHHAIVIPPSVIHSMHVEGDEAFIGLVTHFVTDWTALHECACRALPLTSKALNHLHDFLDVHGEDAMADARRRALWGLVMMEIAHPQSEQPEQVPLPHQLNQALGSELAEVVIECMREDLAAGLRIDELAARTGYSPRQLRSLFRQRTGMSLRDALAQLRLEECKRLLLYSPFKISKIAQMVGFANPNKFSAFFRKHMECTPSQFATRGQHHTFVFPSALPRSRVLDIPVDRDDVTGKKKADAS